MESPVKHRAQPARRRYSSQVLKDNRCQASVESMHHIIEWLYDEDRHHIQAGYGPENITRLRRFSIGLPKTRGNGDYVRPQMMSLARCTRLAFDYLRLTCHTDLCVQFDWIMNLP
jgi:hypothetical protein